MTNNLFVHGVASGDPLEDRVVIWTRVTTPTSEPVSQLENSQRFKLEQNHCFWHSLSSSRCRLHG
ncbi:MAG: PhoD-like phosphatase N-terminal domain-containing protein [Tolypothrix carrinoi HA7290-LM1]|nr:PhoD-like phosphatase N-terminal domain-containing protein [Tolypothrix carrinoi HA7290-LM1]